MSDTIVYAVNDFPAIAKAMKQLHEPTHHGTALALAPTPPGAVMLRPPTMHELVEEEQMRHAAFQVKQQMLQHLQNMQQLAQAQQFRQHVEQCLPQAAQGLQTLEQQQQLNQCNQAYGHSHYMQATLGDPCHSHGLQAAASADPCHAHHQQQLNNCNQQPLNNCTNH